jgi:hypothetical protein
MQTADKNKSTLVLSSSYVYTHIEAVAIDKFAK